MSGNCWLACWRAVSALPGRLTVGHFQDAATFPSVGNSKMAFFFFCNGVEVSWLCRRGGYVAVNASLKLCLFSLVGNGHGHRHISRCHFQYLGTLVCVTSAVTPVRKLVNINILWPNKGTLLTSIIPYDGRRKSPLIHLCQKTSSLVDGIRSTANVKHVYPPRADRLARIHHKHCSFS